MCDSDRVIIYARFGIWRSKLILVERGGTVGGEACVYIGSGYKLLNAQ